MNLLDMVPAFKRHVRQYVSADDTDSTLAAYVADSIYALDWRWGRTYLVTVNQPNSYSVTPDLAIKDYRPIIVMASLIYKMGNLDLARFTDGDFVYSPSEGKYNPIALDIAELDKLLPSVPSRPLAQAKSQPMRGFENAYNPESYSWLNALGVIGAIGSGPLGTI